MCRSDFLSHFLAMIRCIYFVGTSCILVIFAFAGHALCLSSLCHVFALTVSCQVLFTATCRPAAFCIACMPCHVCRVIAKPAPLHLFNPATDTFVFRCAVCQTARLLRQEDRKLENVRKLETNNGSVITRRR